MVNEEKEAAGLLRASKLLNRAQVLAPRALRDASSRSQLFRKALLREQ